MRSIMECFPMYNSDGNEHVFFSNVASDNRLRLQCDFMRDSRLPFTKDWDVSRDVWCLIEQREGILIASPSQPRWFLCTTDNDGVEVTKDKTRADQWLIVKEKDSKGVIIKSVKTNRVLSMTGQNELGLTKNVTRTPLCALWHIEPPHRNVFLLTSKVGKNRIKCRQLGGNSFALFPTSDRTDAEEWRIVFCHGDPGTCKIQSRKHENQYITVTNKEGGRVVTGDKDHASIWQIQKVCDGEYKLVEQISQQALNCDLTLTDSGNDDQVIWILDLPVSGGRSGFYTTALIGGCVLGAVAAPYLVTSAIAYAGFSSTGIVGGSYAAAMMSAEAIASGTGGVAAGGMVATLQSIGAAGLSWTGLTAVAGSGAVVGAVTGVGVAGVVQQPSNGDSQAANSEDCVANQQGCVSTANRPFVNWRNW